MPRMTRDPSGPGGLDHFLESQNVFTSARERIMAVLAHRPAMSLDDLVVASRTPVRTALLVLHGLDAAGLLRPVRTESTANIKSVGRVTVGGRWSRSCGSDGLDAARAFHRAARRRLRPWAARYLAAVGTREEPGLLWGQRRLVPASAMDRAAYVLSLTDRLSPGATVAFLGDDDLVSPLMAAAGNGARVLVVDIDRAVIDCVRRVAADLGAELSARQADLSADPSTADPSTADPSTGSPTGLTADLVVCDPFPSGDGSFESLFWVEGVKMLRPGGLLVSTVAPSHKPERYARGALSRLESLDLQLIDLKADFGRYEVFDFELVAVERAFLAELGLVATISHTKSMLTARYLGNATLDAGPPVDFARWSAAASAHYLTAQAGRRRQLDLTRRRGPSPPAGEPPAGPTPSEPTPAEPGAPTERAGLTDLTDAAGWLDLARRAIESWERWRLDA
jgi:hypothetical protein